MKKSLLLTLLLTTSFMSPLCAMDGKDSHTIKTKTRHSAAVRGSLVRNVHASFANQQEQTEQVRTGAEERQRAVVREAENQRKKTAQSTQKMQLANSALQEEAKATRAELHRLQEVISALRETQEKQNSSAEENTRNLQDKLASLQKERAHSQDLTSTAEDVQSHANEAQARIVALENQVKTLQEKLQADSKTVSLSAVRDLTTPFSTVTRLPLSSEVAGLQYDNQLARGVLSTILSEEIHILGVAPSDLPPRFKLNDESRKALLKIAFPAYDNCVQCSTFTPSLDDPDPKEKNLMRHFVDAMFGFGQFGQEITLQRLMEIKTLSPQQDDLWKRLSFSTSGVSNLRYCSDAELLRNCGYTLREIIFGRLNSSFDIMWGVRQGHLQVANAKYEGARQLLPLSDPQVWDAFSRNFPLYHFISQLFKQYEDTYQREALLVREALNPLNRGQFDSTPEGEAQRAAYEADVAEFASRKHTFVLESQLKATQEGLQRATTARAEAQKKTEIWEAEQRRLLGGTISEATALLAASSNP